MINRRLVVAASTCALVAGGAVAASAVTPPYTPVDVDNPVVVADVGDFVSAYGLEVSARTITWGGGQDGPSDSSEAVTESRAYTPDLGKSALALGATVTPPITQAIDAATTDEWAVGFDPLGDDYLLRVRHAGGAEQTATFVSDNFGPGSGSVAVWGDTALVANIVINLNTGEQWSPLSPCVSGVRAVLADGLLIANDECSGTVVALDVPATGITQDVLDGQWRTVLDHPAGLLAYSRGLLVWSNSGDGADFGYLRLDDPEATEWSQSIPVDVVALRAQGERFVLVVSNVSQVEAGVFEEGTAGDGPVAVVALDDSGAAPVTSADDADGPLATAALPGGDTSEMNLDAIMIDLYGRTLAWSDGTSVLAATLPPLGGSTLAATVPGAATVGVPMTVTAAGLLPGEEVAVWLESDPVLLGMGRAEQDGTFSGSFTVPAGTVAGAHTVTVQGVESGWASAAPIAVAAAANPGLRVDTGR